MRNFKPSIFIVVLLLASIDLLGQAVVTSPRRSPRAQFSQTFGMTKVTIDYGAPKVNVGNNIREDKIWGQQIPFGLTKINFAGQGEIPWRAGADENTTIEFSTDVKVEGKELAAGKYGLHMIIHEDNMATIIFSNNTNSWGSFWYKEAEDAIRVKVQMEDAPFRNVLNYSSVELDGLYTKLALSWEKKRIPFKVEANTLEILTASLKKEMEGAAGFGYLGKLQAAQALMRYNHEMELAEQWIDESITIQKAYQNLNAKAVMQYQKGDTLAMMKYLDESLPYADNPTLNQLGYTLIQIGQLDKAIEYFEINVERNPEDPNVYNSLGEALIAKGEKKKAIKQFKKSNSLNPPQFVRDSNDKHLTDLGAK